MSNENIQFSKYKVLIADISQLIVGGIAKTIFIVFFNVKVTGLENLKSLDGGVIFASNHESDLDTFLIRTALPAFSRFAPLFTVARSSTVYNWHGWRRFVYMDWAFFALGAYGAPKGTHDYEKALKTFITIANSNHSVLIYIGGMQKALNQKIENKGGTAYLAWRTGKPVIPVAIKGAFNISFRKFLSRPKIEVCFGVPLEHSTLFKGDKGDEEDFSKTSSVIIEQIYKMREV
jgi:1-acyl-sn-glycerol-3-phosphate acyltransferase